ncbi:hypothetical protein [Rhodobacter sp. SY28-1]|uniref:hypothetical protein n=1 Tax=Rhodobacter sp. SY28-1 TaxID=2562317 RepID=UPI0010C01F06|nr:hypothetical protein [Rhodobacter sp. SY28-1]
MLNTLIAVVVYECLVALVFILCWRLVRQVDTRLPISTSEGPEQRLRSGPLTSGRGPQDTAGAHWQVFTFLVSAAVLVGVALSFSGTLADLRASLVASDTVFRTMDLDPQVMRLVLPVGQLALLLILFLLFRNSVLFPAIVVHLFLIVFCLLVSLVDPGRIDPARLTLVPIFTTNLVLLILTHGLLTLLFCRSPLELVGSVVLAAIAGTILALGTMVISLISSLLGGPLFFFQLYLVSAFGIFGLYFCVSSILLALWARD